MAPDRESDHVIPDGCHDGCEHETLAADGPPVEDRQEQSDEALRDAISELIQSDLAMHPVYGNTSACGGGIGGASMTAHCAELCPSPKHEAARERHEAAIRRLARWLEGVPLDGS